MAPSGPIYFISRGLLAASYSALVLSADIDPQLSKVEAQPLDFDYDLRTLAQESRYNKKSAHHSREW